MHYNDYKKARNAAWQILIDHKVSELPVRISSICQADGITIRSYKNAQRVISEAGFLSSMESNDGFAVRLKGRDYIFTTIAVQFNDSVLQLHTNMDIL